MNEKKKRAGLWAALGIATAGLALLAGAAWRLLNREAAAPLWKPLPEKLPVAPETPAAGERNIPAEEPDFHDEPAFAEESFSAETPLPVKETISAAAPDPAEKSMLAEEPAPGEAPAPALDFFYCFAWLREEPELAEKCFCELAARREGEAVRCTLRTLREESGFTAPPAFMEKLAALAERHELARWNGREAAEAAGGQKGCSLELEYADGSAVYARDGAELFLPLPALRDLLAAFEKEKEEGRNAI